MTPSFDLCEKCGRLATYLWLGNDYEGMKFLCGYHQRGYIKVVKLSAVRRRSKTQSR